MSENTGVPQQDPERTDGRPRRQRPRRTAKPQQGGKTTDTRRQKRKEGGSTDVPKPGSQLKFPQKPAKNRDPAKDYRFLELTKLLRHFHPLAINGIPPDIIQRRAQTDQPDEGPQNYLENYVLKFITTQPDQPVHVSLQFPPSDPDFPYDVDLLKISLSVPPRYPYSRDARLSIYVLNEEIPRGFAVNLEIGFRRIAAVALGEKDDEIQLVEGKGLLSQIKTLDKYMEHFLRQEKKETIKIIKHRKSREGTPEARKKESEKKEVSRRATPEPKPTVAPFETLVVPDPSASAERARLIQEMNDKFGKDTVKVFKKSPVENKYKVILPLPAQASEIPAIWRNHGHVEVFLHVPGDFPIQGALLLMPGNFSKNLLLRMKDLGEANRTNQQIKTVEHNIVVNYGGLGKKGPPQQTLVCVINWVQQNFGRLCMEPKMFAEWMRVTGEGN